MASTTRARSGRSLAAASALALLVSPALADQIIDLYGTSLTSYLATSATPVQSIEPSFLQRGVFVDGTLRQPAAFGWPLGGDSLNAGGANAWDGRRRMGNLDLATGGFSPTYINMALPAPKGGQWVVGVSFNSLQLTSGGAHRDSTSGPQGANCMQLSQPELRYFSGLTSDLDVIYLVYGADRYAEFKRDSVGSSYFKAKNGAAGVITYGAAVGSEPDTYTITFQDGSTAVFFGPHANSGAAAWQLWKISGESGNTAYVGDPTTGSTAISSGYDGSGRILKAYDAAPNDGRRYTYAYSVHDGVTRLDEVKAEIKTAGTWNGTPTTVQVARVNYSYYTGNSGDGDNGCLKLIKVTTPLSDASKSIEQKWYFRYYTGAYNGGSNPGYPYGLKMVVGPEGYRNYDWKTNSALDDDTQSETTANLKSYSDAYLQYDSNYRVSSAFFNGECGCGGGVNGLYTFSYDDSASKGTYVGNTQYDAGWATRTVIVQPDGTYVTQYFDEVGGPITRVITDANPTGASNRWVTEVVRSSWDSTNHLGGAITEIRTPEANDTYTHNTMGSPDGAVTALSGAGLINTYTRPTSGDMRGMVTEQKHKKGTSGTAYYDLDVAYTSATQTIGSQVLTRPFISDHNSYTVETTTLHDAGKYVTTSWSYTYYTLMQKNVIQTDPSVSSGNNGSGSSTTSARFYNADGTLEFTKSSTGIIGYNAYDGYGLRITSIQDGDTTLSAGGQDFNGVVIPSSPTNYAKSGSALHRKTTYTYDAQGRLAETTLPDSRVTKTCVTMLKDGRSVRLSVPKYVSGSTTSYSPMSYVVSNLAGSPEFTATVAFSGGTTTTAMTSLVSTTSGGDPIASLGTGTITRLQTAIYTNDGHKVTASRQYSVVPGSGAGSAGTNYDETDMAYDTMGRRSRTLDPTGTIVRVVYDALGRQTESWMGTDDNSNGALTGGTSTMTKTEALAYDGGNPNGNSHLTSRTLDADGNWATNTDQRVTSYTYDYRGRALLQTNPQSPHLLKNYDNLGRVTAEGQYSSTANITVGTTDPTAAGTQTDRIGLNTTAYDEMGRVWKTTRYKITLANGTDADSIDRQSWFDPEGRLMKQLGDSTNMKWRFDRIGRRVATFTLRSIDDTQYGHASASTAVWNTTDNITSVAGDKVLEETHSAYDNLSGLVFLSTFIQRHYGDTTTTGELDVNADGGTPDPMKVTDVDVMGRVQITAMSYDSLDRLIESVQYGTNGILGDASTAGGTFNRGGGWSVPTRSNSELRTTNTYDDDGSLLQVEAPGLPDKTGGMDTTGVKTRYTYDAAGRTLKIINNYADGTPGGGTYGDQDQTIVYTYTKGLKTAVTADLPSPATDQVTTYIYGTTKGTPSQSCIATGHLLRAVKYPDSGNGGTTVANIDSNSADVVSYAYNALSQQVYQKDQAGNVIETDYDTGGRQTARKVTTLISGFDGAVKRIEKTYNSRGQLQKVAQYDAASSGNLVDSDKATYDDWGNFDTFSQDVDSDLDSGASGVPAFSVSYAYTKATPSGGSSCVRRTTMTCPGGTDITYEYLGSSSFDNTCSRVTDLKVNSVVVATYGYLGAGTVVRTTLNQASFEETRWNSGVPYTYYMDAFNRTTKSLGYGTSAGGSLHDVDINYDRLSNITGTVDNVNKVGATRAFDYKYTMDDLSRLLEAQRGSLSGGSLSSATRDEQWLDGSGGSGLDQAGNWVYHVLDQDGNGVLSDAADEAQSASLAKSTSYTVANEVSSKVFNLGTGGGTSATTYSPAFDDDGNQTDDGKSYAYVYDAFGRLRKITTRGGGPTLVSEYRYNGLNYRIGLHYDVNSSGGAPDGSDPWYYSCFDERWREVAVFRSSDSDPKVRYVYHNAGLGGTGGSSYIDDVCYRDRDINSGWTSAGDGVLEERRFLCQNWRHDVCAVLSDTGKTVTQGISYSAYGVAYGLPCGDTDSNGDWSVTDQGNITGGYDVRKDTDQNGSVNASDVTWANSITGGYNIMGEGQLSLGAVDLRKGYAGYEFAAEIAPSGTKYHVRNRFYDAGVGRWTRRDPLGYVDGMGLYEYVGGTPVEETDPSGFGCNTECDPCRRCNPCIFPGVALLTDPNYEPDCNTCRRDTRVGPTPNYGPWYFFARTLNQEGERGDVEHRTSLATIYESKAFHTSWSMNVTVEVNDDEQTVFPKYSVPGVSTLIGRAHAQASGVVGCFGRHPESTGLGPAATITQLGTVSNQGHGSWGQVRILIDVSSSPVDVDPLDPDHYCISLDAKISITAFVFQHEILRRTRLGRPTPSLTADTVEGAYRLHIGTWCCPCS